MKRNALIFLVLLSLCALGFRLSRNSRPAGSPFSISHVKLGMSQEEVLAILGPGEIENGFLYYGSTDTRGEVMVCFDSGEEVDWVYGSYLELGNIEYISRRDRESWGPLPTELTALLGEPEWVKGEKQDFVEQSHYPRFNLIVQQGCGGRTFVLSRRERSTV